MPEHQQSSIDRLPPDILEKFQQMCCDPRITQLECVVRINAVLAEEQAAGTLPESAPAKISKSSANRYKVRMDKTGARIRQSREVAQMWIGKLGAEPQGEVASCSRFSASKIFKIQFF